MKPASTLQAIADATGVSRMTVSRALRDDTAVAEATRARIKDAAEKLGYRPNPLVSALMAQLGATRESGFRATLAWVNDHRERHYWSGRSYMRPYFDGARARAAQLGYKLESVHCPELDPEHIPEGAVRIGGVLRARGIPGVILPFNRCPSLSRQAWPGMAVAVLGNHWKSVDYPSPGVRRAPMQHAVSEDFFYNTRLACRSLRALGYRRIGRVSSTWQDTASDGLIPAAFDGEQATYPKAERVPVFFLPPDAGLKAIPDGFSQWLGQWQPDVLLVRIREVADWLSTLGWRVPQDVALAHLGLAEDVAGWSGVDTHFDVLGAAAVDMVVAQLNRNERTLPEYPKEVLIKGSWRGRERAMTVGE